MPTTPQDHKAKGDPFTFEATVKDKAGKSVTKQFTLPPLSETAGDSIPGEITYAAVMEPDNDMAQIRLAFASLEAAKPTEAAMKALRSLSTSRMLEVVGEWMGKAGESSGS